MGYLAQKKKNIREELVLKIMAVTLSVYTVILLLCNDSSLMEKALFQVYCIIVITLIYSLFIRRFVFSLVFTIILLVNYFYISSSSILFFAPQKHSNNMVFVKYSDNEFDIENAEVIQKGFLKLDKTYVSYRKVKLFGVEQLFLGVDFSYVKDVKKHLHQLRSFIIKQDSPVVIVGDFFLPAWSSSVKKFLSDTNLEVKNRLLFVSSKNKNAFFSTPSYNVISFHNIVISDIKITSPKQKQKTATMEFKYGFIED